MGCVSSWKNQGTRTVHITRTNKAVRTNVTFEVLDCDARTYVIGQDVRRDVVGMIYKKVTIEHKQFRQYSLVPDQPGPEPSAPPVVISEQAANDGGPYINSNEVNMKDNKMESRPLTYLDNVPARDWHDYSGVRTIEYKLCLFLGPCTYPNGEPCKQVIYTTDLGTLVISNAGRYMIDGTDLNLKLGAGALTEIGPVFKVDGDRIYAANVNCGKKALTYTFDLETFGGAFNALKTDTPLNVEDYNEYWTKSKRIVGAFNYYGKSDQHEYPYDGEAEKLPDKVMAVGYMDTRR